MLFFVLINGQFNLILTFLLPLSRANCTQTERKVFN